MTSPPLHRLAGQLGHQESRRADLQRIDDFVIKPTRVSGEVLTEGTGEALVDVPFPVWFAQKPSMSFGGELESPIMAEGFFPTVSVVVYQWIMSLDERLGGGYWTGARLAVVTMGTLAEDLVSPQRMIIHWQAEGKAFRMPLDNGEPL